MGLLRPNKKNMIILTYVKVENLRHEIVLKFLLNDNWRLAYF